MRPRNEAALALAVLAALAIGVGVLGRARRGPAPDVSLDASTFAAGPGGARALFDALTRLGIDTRRFRGRSTQLPHLAAGTDQLLALLDPSQSLSVPDARAVVQFGRSADLLLAGPGTQRLMRCFGYKIDARPFDSVRVTVPGAASIRAAGVLVATHDKTFVDSSRVFDVARLTCSVPAAHVTTLLSSSRGPVVVRLDSVDAGHSVILVADVAVLRNRTLRDDAVGVFVLDWFVGRYRRIIFDEYHHGYGASGSLAAATIAWSRQSPWGWMIWQLAGVGLLALLFGAVRFGPAVPVILRRRRSSLEHVEALATALGAAHGHDQAIAAMVRGLRRRLAPPLLRTRRDWRSWLGDLGRTHSTPAAQAALDRLTVLTTPGQPAISVLSAANAAEDVWDNLHH